MNLKILVGFLLFSFVQTKLLDTSKYLGSRQKRALLIWSDAGINWVQFIFGLGLPIEVERHAITMGSVFKAFYLLPTNASEYTQPSIDIARNKRSTSRWTFYKVLETMLARYNHGDGKSCILKYICELSHTPLEERSGLLAEIVTAILKPSTTEEEFHYSTDQDYISAEKLGETIGNCDYHYPGCNLNFFEQYSNFL